MYPIAKVTADIIERSHDNLDLTTTLHTFVGSLQHVKGNIFKVPGPKGEDLLMGDKVTPLFVKERLKGNATFMNEKDVRGITKLQYMIDKAQSLPDHEITVRTHNGAISGVVNRRMSVIDNIDLARHLRQMIKEGQLPEDASAHTYHVSKDARMLHLRIISPSWNHNAGGDPYFAGVSITNNEVTNTPIKISSALARVACFNYVISDNLFTIDPEWGTADDAIQALTRLVMGINSYAEEMHRQITAMGNITLANPNAVFMKVAKDLKLSNRLREDMQEYWLREGQGSTLNDVIQAVTYATQRYTANHLTRPQWTLRDAIENTVFNWGTDILDAQSEGDDINDIISRMALVRKGDVLDILQRNPAWEEARPNIIELEPQAWAN